MNYLCKACFGALISIAVLIPVSAFAGGTHWDPSCNCRRPNVEYSKKRYVREPARVVTRHHVVDHTRVVRGRTKVIQENRKIVHIRPVIHRDVVVHRENTIVKDVVLRQVRASHAYRDIHYHDVVDVYVPGTVRRVTEYYDVRGCCRRGLLTSGY
jgi:hypothetical protein